MADTSKREELIEEAAKAMYFEDCGFAALDDDAEPFRDMARAAFAVFEQAHTPTDDEREALANLIPLDLVHDRGREGFPQDAFEVADAILAAGFRRTVQGEPTDAQVLAALNARELSVRERSGSAKHFNPAPDLSYYSAGNIYDMRAALCAAAATQDGSRDD